MFSGRWIKYLNNTIKVEAMNLSLFEDDSKVTKIVESGRSFLLL